MKKKVARCPNCGAPDKYPDKAKTYLHYGQQRNRPTTYTCGTTTSPDWSPPVYGKDCNNNLKGA